MKLYIWEFEYEQHQPKDVVVVLASDLEMAKQLAPNQAHIEPTYIFETDKALIYEN